MNPRFFCSDPACGRGFHTEEDLETHLSRRHPQTAPKVLADPPSVNEEQEKVKHRLFGGGSSVQSTQVPGKSISRELLLEVSGQDSLDDITEV